MQKQKNLILGFRAKPEERAKLEQIAKATGQGMSEVLRNLVCNVKLEKIEVFRATSTLTIGGESRNAQ